MQEPWPVGSAAAKDAATTAQLQHGILLFGYILGILVIIRAYCCEVLHGFLEVQFAVFRVLSGGNQGIREQELHELTRIFARLLRLLTDLGPNSSLGSGPRYC